MNAVQKPIDIVTGAQLKHKEIDITDLMSDMLKALYEAKMIIEEQNDGCCIASVLDAIEKAEELYNMGTTTH